jgi:hypothetical protein
LKKQLFVNGHEKVVDVKFEVVSTLFTIGSELAAEMLKSLHCSMGSLFGPAGIGMVDKNAFPDWSDFVVNQVMNNAITEGCCKNFPAFWLVSVKKG